MAQNPSSKARYVPDSELVVSPPSDARVEFLPAEGDDGGSDWTTIGALGGGGGGDHSTHTTPLDGTEHVPLSPDGYATVREISPVSWTKIFDIADETDLSAFTQTGDGTFTLTGGVIAQTNAAATNPKLTLPLPGAYLDSFLTMFPLAIQWSAEARVTRALVAGEFAVANGLNRGIEFDEDGTLSDDGVSGTATTVVNTWYAVTVGKGLAVFGSGEVVGVTQAGTGPLLFSITSSTGATKRFGTDNNDKFEIEVGGGVAIEVRNLKISVLVAAPPS